MRRSSTLFILSLSLYLIMVAKFLGCSRYKEKVDILLSMKPQQIAIFKIYPGIGRPLAIPLKSNPSDPMLAAFFDALSDIQPYSTRRDTVKSWKHNWYLEISAKGSKEVIQILFYIPSQQDNIVIGTIGKFNEQGGSYDGAFQSHQLYHWYQKYSHRWLEPEQNDPN